MKRTTPAEILQTSKNKIFLYGPPGEGKTTLASQLPNTLYIACPPDEVISIAANPSTAFMPVLQCTSIQDCTEAVAECLKAEEEVVVFDSTTYLRQMCVAKAVATVKGEISQATWTAANREFFDVIRPLIRDKKHHVIFIGHHRKVKDELTKKVDIVPDFGEGLLRQLIPDIHAAFYYRKEGGSGIGAKRVLFCEAFPGIELKNRYELEAKYENPTMQYLFSEVDKFREKARIILEGSKQEP